MNDQNESDPPPRRPAPAWVRSSVYAAFIFARHQQGASREEEPGRHG